MAVTGYEIELEGVVFDVGNVLTYPFTDLPETPHDARIRAYDAEGNRGPWSAIITDTPLPVPYSPVTALGADLVVLIDAANIAGSDNDPITTLVNEGTGPDFGVVEDAVRATLQTVSGDKVIRFDGVNDRYGSASSINAMTPDWTFYLIVKETSATNNQWVVWAGAENNSILAGYTDNKWDFFNGATFTEIDDADITNFHIVKCTVGTTATGTWYIGYHHASAGGFFAGDVKALVAIKRHLTGPEETELEAWLAAKV